MVQPPPLQRLRHQVETRLSGADPAHDFGHVQRTLAAAQRIAAGEGADREVVQLAALLHDADMALPTKRSPFALRLRAVSFSVRVERRPRSGWSRNAPSRGPSREVRQGGKLR